MPLFEYHCIDCDKVFETLVTDENEVVSCIVCESIDIKKVFSVFGVAGSNDNSPSEADISSEGCHSSCCCCN